MGIKRASIRLRFEALSIGGGPKWVPQPCEYYFHWAILQKNWKRVPFHFASRTVGLEQSVCGDLDIPSELPSLMAPLPQMPFPHSHPPRSVGVQNVRSLVLL